MVVRIPPRPRTLRRSPGRPRAPLPARVVAVLFIASTCGVGDKRAKLVVNDSGVSTLRCIIINSKDRDRSSPSGDNIRLTGQTAVTIDTLVCALSLVIRSVGVAEEACGGVVDGDVDVGTACDAGKNVRRGVVGGVEWWDVDVQSIAEREDALAGGSVLDDLLGQVE